MTTPFKKPKQCPATTDTPARQPHPQRCETCSHYGGHICYQQHNRMSNIELTLIEMVGCASHSTHTSPPAPAFKRCCDSCINVPCKVLNRVPCLAQEKQENVCEENGCTDIENCDEICQHSRLFSPLQMQEAKEQAAKAAREQFANELKAFCNEQREDATKTSNGSGAILRKLVIGLFELKIDESLRAQQERPRQVLANLSAMFSPEELDDMKRESIERQEP